jgi:hypothetical protein
VVRDAAYLEDGERPLPMMARLRSANKAGSREHYSGWRQAALRLNSVPDPGSATIGRNAAVARIRGFKFHGSLPG